MNVKDELKDQLVSGAKLFWEKGLSPGRDYGDLSLRDPKTGYVYHCPKATLEHPIMNWGELTRDDAVVVNASGKIIDSHGLVETVEAPMHMAIYEARPECNAIVHSHGEWSGAFAAAGRNIPSALLESVFIGGEVICTEYAEEATVELAMKVVAALGEKKKAAVMKNHGAVAIGKDLEEAFAVSDFLEKQARVVIRASSLGRVTEVDVSYVVDSSRF